jgi:tRNA(fMet)-specific endonuclease VapC
MSLRYLLDSDTLSKLVRNPRHPVAERIRVEGEGTVCTSIIVASELRFGAAKRGSFRLSTQLSRVLAALPVLPFEHPADERYAELRLDLEHAGTPVGPNDMLIAAHALALDLCVVSGNEAEFSRVPGLRVTNWLV